jgi:hypothetical protein
MPLHRVQQGECLSTIAARYRAKSWQTLHDHPDNAELKKARPNPNILLPGDEVRIPDELEEKLVPCATGKVHRFRVKQAMVGLRVVLKDAEGNVFGGKKYQVSVAGRSIEGVTDGDGLVEVEVPLGESAATLRAWLFEDDDPEDPDIEYDLLIGQLDPVVSVSGLQGRLKNLGFRVPLDGRLGEETARAIQRFRDRLGLVASGEELVDDALCQALSAEHGGA